MSHEYMELKKLSIKNFIGDLPNIINTNFENIKNLLNKIFDADTQTIKVTNTNVSNKITTNTLVTNNLKVIDGNGKYVDFGELVLKLEKIQSAIGRVRIN